jgi:hypothetical protein
MRLSLSNDDHDIESNLRKMEVEAHGGGGVGAHTGRSCDLPDVMSSDIREPNIDENAIVGFL